MKKRALLFLIFIVLLAITFWGGTKTGRYLSSIERENLYPFEQRELWVSNQPTCVDYDLLSKGEKSILVSIVKDGKNQNFVKIVSLPEDAQDNKLIFSILNRDQEQFIDEVWLECK